MINDLLDWRVGKDGHPGRTRSREPGFAGKDAERRHEFLHHSTPPIGPSSRNQTAGETTMAGDCGPGNFGDKRKQHRHGNGGRGYCSLRNDDPYEAVDNDVYPGQHVRDLVHSEDILPAVFELRNMSMGSD